MNDISEAYKRKEASSAIICILVSCFTFHFLPLSVSLFPVHSLLVRLSSCVATLFSMSSGINFPLPAFLSFACLILEFAHQPMIKVHFLRQAFEIN